MLSSLRTRWRDLIDGFWFVPGLITAGFFIFAILTLALDRTSLVHDTAVGFGGDPPAARSILTTIAGSLITVAGLTFSITIVTLQLVSSQFTPRVIRTLLGDRLTKITMGAFVGIFTYCLLILRAVREQTDPGEVEFVPALSVTLSIVFAVIALALLIAFIHHTAVSIQVSAIIARVTREALSAAEGLYPELHGEPEEPEEPERLLERWNREDPAVIRPRRPGFVQRVAVEQLVESLGGKAESFHIVPRPGDFVTEKTDVIRVWPAERIDDELRKELRAFVYVADERDVDQDIAFGLRQLADIALRAVSPGINDPTTAVTAIAYMTAVCERLAGRRFPLRLRRWNEPELAGIVERQEFQELVGMFREIAVATRDEPRVTISLLDAVGRIAAAAGDERRGDLARLADAIGKPALEKLTGETEQREVEQELSRVRSILGYAAG